MAPYGFYMEQYGAIHITCSLWLHTKVRESNYSIIQWSDSNTSKNEMEQFTMKLSRSNTLKEIQNFQEVFELLRNQIVYQL